MTPARLRWGLILVQIGILILLVNVEVINYNFVPDLVYAFPFFLIAVGVEKIFTRSRMEFISYLAVCTIFLGGLYIAWDGSSTDGNPSFFEKTTYREKYDPSVKTLRAVMELGRGDLTVRDATDAMVYGKFAEFTSKPRVKYDVDGDVATINFDGGSRHFHRGLISIDDDRDNDWTLYFSRSTPLEMQCFGDASYIHLNMATTPLRKLEVDADDADIYVKIGDLEPIVEVSLQGHDADLRLRLPEGSGVRVSAEGFAAYLRRIGLLEQGDFFVNEGYDTLPNKVDVDLDERMDNLKIEFY